MAQCTAHSSRTGERCKKAAIQGGTVCPTHGGSAPQVKKAAAARVAELRDLVFDRISESLTSMTAKQLEALQGDAQGIRALVDAAMKLSEHHEVLEGRVGKRGEVIVHEQSDFDREIEQLMGQLAGRSKGQAVRSADQ